MLDHAPYYRGFDKTVCLTEFGASGQAPELVARALDWLEDNAGRPTLLYLHILDPHAPYAPGPGEYERFVTARPPDPLTMHDDLRRKLSPLKAAGFGPGDPRFENVVQRYDAEIAFVDGAIESLFEGMDRLGVLDSTLAVITADPRRGNSWITATWNTPGNSIPRRTGSHVVLAPRATGAGARGTTCRWWMCCLHLLHLEGVPGGGGMNGSALFREEEDGGVRPDISPSPGLWSC
jgi:arylsulfatase A-like enzyme